MEQQRQLELQLVREFSQAVGNEIAAVRAARTQGDDAQARLELDRDLCKLHEREAEITSRLGDARDGDILAELDRVHYLMFVLETLVWLQMVEIDDQPDRQPIEYVVLQNTGALQLQRVEFLVGQLASTATAEWPFAGSATDRLTQQSVICYLLPPRYATQYASYCSIPAPFQQYMHAFREIDELMHERTSVHGMHTEASLAVVSQPHDGFLASCVQMTLITLITLNPPARVYGRWLYVQHDVRLEEVLKHALAAELDASCGGRGGKLTVPASWKWKLLHDVNEIETSFEHASASSAGTGQQDMKEPFSYRLWLMVHTGLQHVTHADTLLELQLVIHNSGTNIVSLDCCVRITKLTSVNPQALPMCVDGFCDISTTACPLLVAGCRLTVCWLLSVRCLILRHSAASWQLNVYLLDARDLVSNRLWALFCDCVLTQRQILRFSRSCESALKESTFYAPKTTKT